MMQMMHMFSCREFLGTFFIVESSCRTTEEILSTTSRQGPPKRSERTCRKDPPTEVKERAAHRRTRQNEVCVGICDFCCKCTSYVALFAVDHLAPAGFFVIVFAIFSRMTGGRQ